VEVHRGLDGRADRAELDLALLRHGRDARREAAAQRHEHVLDRRDAVVLGGELEGVVGVVGVGLLVLLLLAEWRYLRTGDELYRNADLSTVWVIAEVPERDIGSIIPGDRATIIFRAFSSKPMEGRVTLIYPELKPETRTARVRIELPNPDGRLKPDMYADVVFHADAEDKPAVAVPDSAVIDSGTRQLVLIAKGEGRFEPRTIKTGRRGDGYVEVLEGVKAGEEVVTSATFLIDAESNLRAALKGFTQQEPQK